MNVHPTASAGTRPAAQECPQVTRSAAESPRGYSGTDALTARNGSPAVGGVAIAHGAPLPAVSAPYVIFDFDGTLARVREGAANREQKIDFIWADFISMAFLKHLGEQGLVDRAEYAFQQRLVEQMVDGKINYDQWVDAWAHSWARGLRGRKETEIKAAARTFFVAYAANIYPEAKGIVDFFAARGFDTVMMSAGVMEVVELAQEHLGLKHAIATRCVVKNGVYTDELLDPDNGPHTEHGKGEIVDKLAATVGNPTFTFGDSTGDLSMHRKAQVPVCLNANRKLRDAAPGDWVRLSIADLPAYLANHPKANPQAE